MKERAVRSASHCNPGPSGGAATWPRLMTSQDRTLCSAATFDATFAGGRHASITGSSAAHCPSVSIERILAKPVARGRRYMDPGADSR